MTSSAVLTLILMLSSIGGVGQLDAQAGGLDLGLRYVTRQLSFSMKDSLVLDFAILNSSSRPVGVFAKLGMGYQGGIILHVLDSAGAEVQPPVLAHDFLDLRGMDERKNYFELQPGQFWGTRQSYSVSELVWKAGRYKLLAEYHCPVDSKYAKVANFWGIEHKSVISGELEFIVE